MDDAADFREPHLRHADFLGAFGILRRGDTMLFVQNRRVIGGREVDVWDLPGGQVEPGELLLEALARELHEEVGVHATDFGPLLFLQEGERRRSGRRHHAWRSFFFEVTAYAGEPEATDDVAGIAWLRAEEFAARLRAPYHDSFLAWSTAQPPAQIYHSVWDDA